MGGRLLAVMICCATVGCSITVQEQDAKTPANVVPKCESAARGRLIVDTGAAIWYAGVGTLLLYTVHAGDGCENFVCDGFETIGITHLVSAVVYGLAAMHNVRATRACRRAWKRHEEWRTSSAR